MTDIPQPLLPGLDNACPQCGRAVGDHTIRGWGDCLTAQGFNTDLPYAEVPDGPIRVPHQPDDQIMVGSLDVKAGALDTPLGTMPVVLFRFYAAGLEPMSTVPTPEYMLVLDADGMQRAKELIVQSANAAIRAARS